MDRRPFVALAVGAMWCTISGGCSGGPDGRKPALHLPAPVAQSVGTSGGAVATTDGAVQVDIPQGALPANTTITIAPNTDAAPPAHTTVVGIPIRLGPDGLQFAEPIQVTLEFDPSLLPPDTPASALVVYTARDGSSDYHPLPTTVLDATHVVATTTHFSTDVVALPKDGIAAMPVDASADALGSSCPSGTPGPCGANGKSPPPGLADASVEDSGGVQPAFQPPAGDAGAWPGWFDASAWPPAFDAAAWPPGFDASGWPPPGFDASGWPPPGFDGGAWPPPGFDASGWPPPGFDGGVWPPPGFDASGWPPGFDGGPPGFEGGTMPSGFDAAGLPPDANPSAPGFDGASPPPGFDASAAPPGFDASAAPPGFDAGAAPPGFSPPTVDDASGPPPFMMPPGH